MNGALIKNAVLRAGFRVASRGVSHHQLLLEAAALEEQDAAECQSYGSHFGV